MRSNWNVEPTAAVETRFSVNAPRTGLGGGGQREGATKFQPRLPFSLERVGVQVQQKVLLLGAFGRHLEAGRGGLEQMLE